MFYIDDTLSAKVHIHNLTIVKNSFCITVTDIVSCVLQRISNIYWERWLY